MKRENRGGCPGKRDLALHKNTSVKRSGSQNKRAFSFPSSPLRTFFPKLTQNSPGTRFLGDQVERPVIANQLGILFPRQWSFRLYHRLAFSHSVTNAEASLPSTMSAPWAEPGQIFRSLFPLPQSAYILLSWAALKLFPQSFSDVTRRTGLSYSSRSCCTAFPGRASFPERETRTRAAVLCSTPAWIATLEP